MKPLHLPPRLHDLEACDPVSHGLLEQLYDAFNDDADHTELIGRLHELATSLAYTAHLYLDEPDGGGS